jgi:ABC-type microcin C transport system permease subunit YejB
VNGGASMNHLLRIFIFAAILLSLFSSTCFADNFPTQAISAAEQFISLIDKKGL